MVWLFLWMAVVGFATGWLSRMLWERYVAPWRRRQAWYAGRPRLR